MSAVSLQLKCQNQGEWELTLGKLVLPKVGVILIEFRALLAVWLFVGLPFFFQS